MTAPVYLLTGESFLADDALDRIRAEASIDPLSEVAFGPGASGTEIVNAVETSSLLGGRRLVIVRGVQDLKKEQTDALTRYIAAPSPDSILVLIAEGRTKLESAVKKTGEVVTLDAPRGRKLIAWIRRRALDQGLQVDERSAWALVDSVGPNLRDLDGALGQTMTALGPGARVGAAEVRRLFPRLADERIYVLTDAVGDRKEALAMATVRRLLEQGEHPLVLLGALAAHVRRMLVARRAAGKGTRAVAELLRMPDWKAERLARQALSYGEDELVAALQDLAAADLEMKTGESAVPEIAIERVVVRMLGGRGAPVA